ncbi:hypothetical protein ACLF6K_19430 [Streptomyces xanthophaeus]|uniref:hypothetical protein n=1 Tax=Streptomyces xanthophaeus TaxID=67385 RepID=UPI0039903A56
MGGPFPCSTPQGREEGLKGTSLRHAKQLKAQSAASTPEAKARQEKDLKALQGEGEGTA